MEKILLCWLGRTDIRASEGEDVGAGPIAQAVSKYDYSAVHVLSNYPDEEAYAYMNWLQAQTDAKVSVQLKPLTSPTNFEEIYIAARGVLKILEAEGHDVHIHLSPGTPAMAAVWIILAQTTSNTTLIESSVQQGVKKVSFPFNLAAEFIPTAFGKADDQLKSLSEGLPPQTPEFDDIIHSCDVMKRAVLRARKVALRSVPVLIEGESGTGKELFARAIHSASPRSAGKFVTVNCGAIPAELVESELFGHEKGSFTGADKLRRGYFEEADGGTIFLDEIGELPKLAQVKLLRVLQENEVVRVGAVTPTKVNVRIIAATNRNLIEEAAVGNFRMDLFYRLAVALLKLPPLRERGIDVSLLIDKLMEQVNLESKEEPNYKDKKISVSAKKIMQRHSWPGNVRELLNTIRRAAIWSGHTEISAEDAEEAILLAPSNGSDLILDRPIEQGIDLDEIIGEVSLHYLERAMNSSGGNKSKAAKLLGFKNYQTLTNKLKKYQLEA